MDSRLLDYEEDMAEAADAPFLFLSIRDMASTTGSTKGSTADLLTLDLCMKNSVGNLDL